MPLSSCFGYDAYADDDANYLANLRTYMHKNMFEKTLVVLSSEAITKESVQLNAKGC